MGRYDDYGGWAPYVPVAKRQQQAKQKAAALRKQGHECQPVTITGRAIAASFWGQAWCTNLESYSDYENRLPRGRTYVRNGSVIDLCIEPGKVRALVSGSDIYEVEITVQPLAATLWEAIVRECSGKVASVIELLQGRLSAAVMETVTRQGSGLFPQPLQIRMDCSCPDGASMCKHVAAVLYGVGARLDHAPELLFRLRHVEPQELILRAGAATAVAPADAQGGLDGTDLSALFGIDIDDAPAAPVSGKPATAARGGAAAAPAKTGKAPAKKAAAARADRNPTITAGELIARGVARHQISNWLTAGVLLRTAQRGTYQTTALTEARIRAYVTRIAGR